MFSFELNKWSFVMFWFICVLRLLICLLSGVDQQLECHNKIFGLRLTKSSFLYLIYWELIDESRTTCDPVHYYSSFDLFIISLFHYIFLLRKIVWLANLCYNINKHILFLISGKIIDFFFLFIICQLY